MCVLFKEGEDLKDVAIIIPYFGKLPSNLITFLNSCQINKRIDWFIFTDQNLVNIQIPKNVHIVNTTFSSIKEKIQLVVNLKGLVLDAPYKLCDYKPTYGVVFQKYISKYKYWGYSDMDVVYGNLWKYIEHGIKNGYDKIGHLGHFTLFKNNVNINNRYRLPIIKNKNREYPYKRAFTTSKTCHFDEDWGINLIYKQHKFPIYDNENLVNEPFPENMNLRSVNKKYYGLPQLYIYSNNRCLFFYKKENKIYKEEFGYFHFQKRRFTKYIYDNCNDFYMDDSGFNELKIIDNDTINFLLSKRASFVKRLLYMGHAYFHTDWFTDRKLFGYYLPVKHIYNRIFKERNFFV